MSNIHKNILIALFILSFSACSDGLKNKEVILNETPLIFEDVKEELEAKKLLLKWREVGPSRGGRSCTVSGVASSPHTFYAGYTGGGVWKTIDAGHTWKNISDGFFGGSIGAIAVSQNNPQIIYVGEGEKTVRGNVSTGKGAWRSDDAGKTWASIGLKDSKLISRLRIHPENPDIVYAAVLGDPWKDSDSRGVYKTIDGGKSWQRILFSNNRSGAVDLVLDPSDPSILYASTYNVRRNGYRLDSGGKGSKLWKSIDAGENWKVISENPGMPVGTKGNMGIAVSPVDPNRVWAVVEAEEGGLYRSDDGGATWVHTSDFVELYQKAYYYNRVVADPKNKDKVIVLNTRYHISENGGYDFQSYRGVHVDHHDLWINPDRPEMVAIANDGGVQISLTNMKTWSSAFNQPTAQIYRVSTDNAYPFKLYGGQQDWGTLRIENSTNPVSRGNDSDNQMWEATAGGESGYVAPDPLNDDIVYAGTYKGYMMRLDHRSSQNRSVNIWPYNPAGWGVEVMKYRFNWNFPVFFSPHDPKKLYAASNHLHLSTNEGHSWTTISPDLTKGDPETLRSSGGPIADDNTGVEYYGTITTAVESAYSPGEFWTGSDDGYVHLSKDYGKNWKNVSPKGLAQNALINDIVVDPHIRGGAYLAVTAYKFGDYKPYLYRTINYGESWDLITNGIPDDQYTRTIEADPVRDGLLFAGTEWGFFISMDHGKHWTPYQLNLPIVSVRDLLIKDNKLIAATHGRGFWILENLQILREIPDSDDLNNLTLFAYKQVYRGEKLEIPFIKAPMISQRIKILDDQKKLIREFTVDKGTSHGIIEWDLRAPGYDTISNVHFYAARNKGPLVVPGVYFIESASENKQHIEEFRVLADPRSGTSIEDLKLQFAFLQDVIDKVSEANQALALIRHLRRRSDLDPDVADRLRTLENVLQNEQIVGGRDPLKYGVGVNNRLAFLLSDQQRGDFPPTGQAKEVFEQLCMELQAVQDQLKELQPK